MLFLFMLLSTLINQEARRFYFKLQKMFTLSRAMTISYMAYPSLQRKEKILRNSPGKLIFKAVGGRGEKKTNNTTKTSGTQSPTQRPAPRGPGWLLAAPAPAACPFDKRRTSLGRDGREPPRQGQTAAPVPGALSSAEETRN